MRSVAVVPGFDESCRVSLLQYGYTEGISGIVEGKRLGVCVKIKVVV